MTARSTLGDMAEAWSLDPRMLVLGLLVLAAIGTALVARRRRRRRRRSPTGLSAWEEAAKARTRARNRASLSDDPDG